MRSVEEVRQLVLEQAQPLPPRRFPLADAVGLVLAEDVLSDVDSPPYDKSLADGYAIRSADLPTGQGELTIIEEVSAGKVPTRPVGPGQATRIMTGAPIPAQGDAVVFLERSTLLGETRVRLDDRPPVSGQNVLARGAEMRSGELILTAHTPLRPQEVGVLATVGKTQVQLIPRPRVAILATGDELVEPDQVPGQGQIRNSNGPMLSALVARAGGVAHYLGIGRDRQEHLVELIQQGLQADVLLLAGGVSAGAFDLVPGTLQSLGVQARAHRIALKPGKPLFFGTYADQTRLTLVFGLPGNPVSSLVTFELFVRPTLRKLAGYSKVGPSVVSAQLLQDFPYQTDRPTYHPARLSLAGSTGSSWIVVPVPWAGSADLRGLTYANALLILPVGDHVHQEGAILSVVALDAGGDPECPLFLP